MGVTRLLCVLALVCCSIGSAAGAVRHINVRDGLSSRQVYTIAEDPDGYMWIYTNSGLDRYDGYFIKHYTLAADEEQNNHIQSATTMATAPDGTLWIAVKSGSVYRYDRRLDRFERAFEFPDKSILLYDIRVDADNSLVVATNAGLYRCDTRQGVSLMALDGKFASVVERDGAQGYYVGTDHGVYHVTRRGGSYRSRFFEATEGIYVKSIAKAGGKLFVGSFSSGVVVLGADGRRVHMAFQIPQMPINTMHVMGADSVLIGVDGAGVYLVGAADGRLIRHYSDSDGTDDELSGNTITDVHVDRHNGIWITTSHNGLNYISPAGKPMAVLKSKRGDPDSLISDYVNVIYEDTGGDIWYGTDKGVTRYSPSQRRWWNYLGPDIYRLGVVLSLGEDSRGRILVGTYGGGLSIIDKTSGTVGRLPVQTPGSAGGTGTGYVFTGFGMPGGDIWIGGINGSLTRYNPDTDTYHYYDEDCIASVVNGPEGPLFAGNKGVGTYSSAADSFSWTQEFDTVRITYPVRAVQTDSAGAVLWVGTSGDGLVRYDRRSGHARRFTTADGLSSNTIYSLVLDTGGRLWACTETDLYRYDDASGRLMRFTSFLGTERGAFNAGGATCTRSGEIMLGTAEGCVVFNPAAVVSKYNAGPILLTDMRLRDRSIEPGRPDAPLECNINLADGIVLTHRQNSFEIDFALIDYDNPRRIGFECMLDGYDKAFAEVSGAPRVRYTDLAPGTYTLIIRAVDLYSGNPVAERTLGITVMAPMLLSWWAIVIYILLSGGLLWLGTAAFRRFRRERHIQSQLRSYAAIAHDIRTPMSMIKAPLLSLELENDLSDSARANLRRARSGIDKTMGMLDELMGLRREACTRRRLSVQPVEILRHLEVKAEEYATMALFKGIRIECSVEEGLTTVPVDRERFDHIVDNLLSNALKYTNEGTITLSASRSGHRHWCLSVADTGIGMSVEDARLVFKRRHRSAAAADCDAHGTGLGLLITRRLVAECRGTIRFGSVQGKGSTFVVELPLEYPARYRAAGPSPSPSPEADASVPADASASDSRNTLYIIEDDPDMRSLLRESLQGEYNIIDTDNPAAALDDIRLRNPDLVISDVMMPRLRGDELCRMLKTNLDTSHIPVILLTGLGGREDIIAGLEASADDYIVKPFDIVVLKARIRNIIKSRRELGHRVLSEDCEPAREEFSSELDRQFMTRTMTIISEKMGDSEYSINELCADLGMGRTSVYNKIKSISGQSPNEFIRIMRLNRAKELLSTHIHNISEVAYMVGFSDPKYFSTCFKKQFGYSPSKV